MFNLQIEPGRNAGKTSLAIKAPGDYGTEDRGEGMAWGTKPIGSHAIFEGLVYAGLVDIEEH
jgi:hypothetical protein